MLLLLLFLVSHILNSMDVNKIVNPVNEPIVIRGFVTQCEECSEIIREKGRDELIASLKEHKFVQHPKKCLLASCNLVHYNSSGMVKHINANHSEWLTEVFNKRIQNCKVQPAPLANFSFTTITMCKMRYYLIRCQACSHIAVSKKRVKKCTIH